MAAVDDHGAEPREPGRHTGDVLARLAGEGRLRLATRPGCRPVTQPGDGTNLLADTLAAMRDEER